MSVPAAAAADRAVLPVHQGGKIAATTAALAGGCNAISKRHTQLVSIKATALEAEYQDRQCFDDPVLPVRRRLIETG